MSRNRIGFQPAGFATPAVPAAVMSGPDEGHPGTGRPPPARIPSHDPLDATARRTSRHRTAGLDCGAAGRVPGPGLRVAAPFVDLLVRLSLAKTFFDPGMLPHIPALDVLRSASAAILVQVSGPLLLVAGFLIRAVALSMLVLTLLAQVGAPHDEHLFWAALFGWYVVQGAGALSLDHLLGKGLGLSPLPLAGRATAAADWFDRQVAPLYRLALRLWLAASIIGATLAPMMLPGMQAGVLPRPAALLAALCLALGFGTPVVCGVLLLASSGAAMMGSRPGDDALRAVAAGAAGACPAADATRSTG